MELSNFAREKVLELVALAQEQVQPPPGPQQAGLVDQYGNPLPPSGLIDQANGALPAEPQPPTVGADMAAASQSAGAQLGPAGRAGQGTGYYPPDAAGQGSSAAFPGGM